MNQVQFNNQSITPSKVICIGRNYVEHIEELNNEVPASMVVFNKANNCVTDELKYFSKDTRFEGEICFLMNKGKIDGIGFGLDLTKADIQNHMKQKGLPWERAKSFDGAAVLSDFVIFEGDVQDLRFELFVNDGLQQFANYDLMIYKPKEMIEEIQSFMRIEDGDIIMTGTPKGVSTYNIGDTFVGKVYCNDELLLEKEFIAK
ncbi:MAG: fumarylacetoacetate hydrolase family protein [Campylobacterota bacterium]|nr:fumarylacetoacetate hydrolase family protein [Campylobacterota bacterium]